MDDLTPIADALQGRLLDVVNDVLAEYGGGIVQGFLMCLDFLDDNGEPSFVITVAPEQRTGQTAGLAMLANVHSERALWAALDD